MADRPRVVVVDEDLFLRPAIESSLVGSGYEVTHTASARTFEAAIAERPAAILVNATAETIEWGVLVATARERHGAELPIVAFGPHVDVALKRRALESGCTEFVPNGLVAKGAARVVGAHLRSF